MNLDHVKKIGLFVKPHDAAATKLASGLTDYLLERYDAVLSASHSVGLVLNSKVSPATIEEICTECQLVIAIGGDGTLLAAGHSVSHVGIPLIGINLGTLGFLVDVRADAAAEILDKILAGEHTVENRCLFHVTYMHDNRVFKEYDACNDVVIKHKNSARMIEIETITDNRLLNTLLADGIMLSTPTGSTAYALSAGGPLIEPSLDAILLVPICPHALTHRPIVLSPSHDITLIYTHHNSGVAMVSVDGQTNENLHPGDRVSVKLADYKMQLIHPPGHNFFDTLRFKFNWGQKHPKTQTDDGPE